MVVTVDSGGVPIEPGSSVTFRIRPSVATLGGLATPYQLDTASWVPDPDSAGGIASEARYTGACTGGVDCVRTIGGSGTIRLVAHVNGKGFEASYHISTPLLSLGASPEQFDAGDSVTFTPKWSDEAPITGVQVVGWQWTPGALPATTTGCGAGTATCGRRVYQSGEMTVAAVRGGITHSAKVHVGPRDRFELTANPIEVAPGRIVTFTPLLNGTPTVAARWRWVPAPATWDSVAGCPAATKCHRVTMGSGMMWAYQSPTPGSGDSASIEINVNEACLVLSMRGVQHPANSVSDKKPPSRSPVFAPVVAALHTETPCGAGGGEGSSEADSLPKVTLDVDGAGVLDASPAVGTSLQPRDVVIPYRFVVSDAAVQISVDNGPLMAPIGAIQMDTSHTIAVIVTFPCSGTSMRNGKDSLRLQYSSHSRDTITTVPGCEDFLYRPTLSFGDYNLVRDHSPPPDTTNYAILASIVWQKVRDLHDSNSFTVDTSNRIYSTPNHQIAVNRFAPNSRHIYGAAADLRNAPANDSVYWAGQRAIVKSVSPAPCVEPFRFFRGSHLHVDWRYVAGVLDSQGRSSCPDGW